MNISRRGFLTSLVLPVVLDPERLLWVPGQKKIFIPEKPVLYRKPKYYLVHVKLPMPMLEPIHVNTAYAHDPVETNRGYQGMSLSGTQIIWKTFAGNKDFKKGRPVYFKDGVVTPRGAYPIGTCINCVPVYDEDES